MNTAAKAIENQKKSAFLYQFGGNVKRYQQVLVKDSKAGSGQSGAGGIRAAAE